MRRAFKQAWLSSRVKQKKPKLFSKCIRDQLDFAKRHRNWTVSDWKRVIFLDECKINCFNCEIWWWIDYDMGLYDTLWLWAFH